jgi:hypothetical protein
VVVCGILNIRITNMEADFEKCSHLRDKGEVLISEFNIVTELTHIKVSSGKSAGKNV